MIPVRRGEIRFRCAARVPGGLRLEKQDLRFLIRRRAMLEAAWYDEKFAFVQLYYPVAEFDPHPSAPNEKQFVLRVVMVPRKCPLEFHKLYFLTVQFPDDLGPPVFCKGTELFCEVHFFHGVPHLTATTLLRKPDYRGALLPVFVLQSPRALR